MELKDFLVTPLLVLLVFFLAYFIRPKASTPETRPYFMPALGLKILAAVALGIIYQFYYGGGDTFGYHTFGSRYIWEAFQESPKLALKLIFNTDQAYHPETYHYASKIWYYGDSTSYFVVRLAGLIDIFTFGTYSATAVVFACFAFSGVWALYQTFVSYHPRLKGSFALAVLFMPSVVFWGSGLLKDTIVVGALGWLIYGLVESTLRRRRLARNLTIAIGAFAVIYTVKIYVLMTFVPAFLLWFYLQHVNRINSYMIRVAIAPVLLGLIVYLSFVSVASITDDNSKYSINNIARTVRITAYDIGFYTGRDAGSGYSLGELDDSFGSIITKAPAAINVSLFRPYLWEVSNPLMLLSALESLFLLYLTVRVVINRRFFKALTQIPKLPHVVFCIVFSISFAVAVGVATYNFGTLARYKIPLLPFYAVAMFVILDFYQERKMRQKKLSLPAAHYSN